MSAFPIEPDVAALREELIATRRDLHQHPEIGFEEHRTSAIVAERLRALGYEVRAGVAGTGVIGVLNAGKGGKTVALRADMDCLPLDEQNDVTYRSQTPGRMHACGHDGHTSIGLGAAKVLAARKDRLPGTVKLLFQPAEEGPGGAHPMIQAGALADPKVDAIFGLHLWNDLPVGQAGISEGAFMASTDEFSCTIHGKGGHGAKPEQTVDSVLVAAHAITALQSIVSRNVSAFKPAVVTVGKISGGSACNIIADQVHLLGTLRAYDHETRALLPKRVEEVLSGVCQSFGARCEFILDPQYPPTINDSAMARLVRETAQEILGPGALHSDCLSMGGEDMAYFLREVPGCYFFLGSANAARGLNYPHHHPRFDFDEEALVLGVQILTRTVERYLGNG